MQQYIFEFPKREILTRDVFIVAECNRAAFDIIQLWPKWPMPFLAIYGGCKSGKSHLAAIWAEHANAQKITVDMLAGFAISQNKDAIFWLEIGEMTDSLRKELSWQEALFHLYNHIIQKGEGALLITSTIPPSRWQVDLKDLQSRLNGLPAFELGLPDDLLLEKLLMKLCADRQLIIGTEVIRFLLRRIERSFDSMYLLCDRLDQKTLEKQKPITIALAKTCLEA